MTTHDAANLAGTVAMKADPVAVVAVKAVPTAEAAGGGRGGHRTDRPGNGQRDRLDADGKPMFSAAEEGASVLVPASPEGGKPEARNERPVRNERGGRGERARHEGGDRPRNEGGERVPSTERNGPRPESTRNERRPERSRRTEEAASAGILAHETAQAHDESTLQSVNNETAMDLPTSGLVSAAPQRAEVTQRAEVNAPREKRSRDRYGRERGPRAERGEAESRGAEAAADPISPMTEAMSEEPRKSYFSAPAPVVTPVELPSVEAPKTEPGPSDEIQAQAKPVEMASPQSAPAPVERLQAPAAATLPPAEPAQVQMAGMPELESFVLPLSELTKVAQNSGLNWVNSDSEKIAAVQAAIAAEAKPVHVPRVRPAPVHIETGSLVLVETKRDLREMTLPFEEKTRQ